LNQRFAVIRALRILSESTSAPKPSNNLFTAPAGAPGNDPANPFAGNFFGAFGDAFAQDEPAAEEAGEDDPEAENAALQPVQPALPATPSTRILGQVAGSEQVRVFVRFDVMEVLNVEKDNQADES